jgi:hypothetical protein
VIRALGAPSLAALALLVGGGRQENGADHEHASVLDVKILGKRDRHRWRDLDGDGRLDLLVVSRFDRPLAASLPPIVAPLVPLRVTAGVGRRIEVVWNGPSGLDVEKRTTFAVPASARCFAIADVLPESGLDLVLLDAGGARAVPLSPSDRGVQGASRYRRVAVERSFFEFPPEGELPEWGLTLGPAGRRRGALILPTPEGFRVWRLTAAEGDGPPAKLEPA